ncbi:ubiquinol-cytochrome c reductase cytochrome b subunit [Alcaligenes faecalis subsp. faecalis NCIB 8687]|nr:ubiquinol-cytochrome c reductase cytochrome b subunit [Alcaligenes faecalis subsp. faecalis NCIB 8687]
MDGIPFHPYYTVHDILGVAGFLIVFAAIVFFAPEMGGYFLEFNNFSPDLGVYMPSGPDHWVRPGICLYGSSPFASIMMRCFCPPENWNGKSS